MQTCHRLYPGMETITVSSRFMTLLIKGYYLAHEPDTDVYYTESHGEAALVLVEKSKPYRLHLLLSDDIQSSTAILRALLSFIKHPPLPKGTYLIEDGGTSVFRLLKKHTNLTLVGEDLRLII